MSAVHGDPAETAGHRLETIEVEATTLRALLHDGAPDAAKRVLLKVDVEGHEPAVLRGLPLSGAGYAELAALVEIRHLGPTDLSLLLRAFDVDLFDPQAGTFARFGACGLDALLPPSRAVDSTARTRCCDAARHRGASCVGGARSRPRRPHVPRFPLAPAPSVVYSRAVITVLMTTRDGAVGLPAVLDAYERLEAPRGGWRVVAVDDGSRDGTLGLLEGRRSRLPLTVVACPAQGLNASRNRGLSELEGDLVVFTDDDSVPRPDWLVRIRAAADAHPEVDVIACTVKARFEVEPDPWVLAAVRRGPNFAWVDLPASGPVDPVGGGPSFAVRRAIRGGSGSTRRSAPTARPPTPWGAETEILLRLERAGRRRGTRGRRSSSIAFPLHGGAGRDRPPRGALWAGPMRLRTSRLSRARLRWRGVPSRRSRTCSPPPRGRGRAGGGPRGDPSGRVDDRLPRRPRDEARARALPDLGACRRLLPCRCARSCSRGASVPCRSSASSPGPA
jgi:hypothetical protein